MSGAAELSADGRTLTVRVPVTVSRRGGRKVVIAPEGDRALRSGVKPNEALVRALARAFRWRSLIEKGEVAIVSDLAKAESVSASYVARILRLTLLAPDIVEAILDGQQLATSTMMAVSKSFPVEWAKQRALFS